jgi:predicted PurR-regulated permease PerM
VHEPVDRLRQWLPHVLLLGLVAGAVGFLALVVWPLRDALLLAGSIGLLTYPILFLPLLQRFERWTPHWAADQRRFAAAAVATATVGIAVASVLLGGLWLIFGKLDQVANLLSGLLLGDGGRLDHAIDALVRKLSRLVELYPQLPWDSTLIKASLREALGRGAIGQDMIGFLFRGTIGVMATSAMTLIVLFYLYAQGSQLVGLLMRWLPLTALRREQLAERFRHLAIYVAAGVLLRAAVHGLVCGLIAWAMAGANPIGTAAVATFLALLPVVGPAIAWIPYATVLWSTGRELPAVSLAVACITAAWVVELSFRRLARRLGADSLWFAFLLFCGLVGGIATFGFRGVIIGPAVALTAAALFGFLPAVYGVGREPVGEAGVDADADP